MLHLRILDAFYAAMPPTKVVQPYREPTHPPVLPRHFGESQRLPDLPLMPPATGPVMPFDDTGVDLLIAPQGQHVFHPGFAIPQVRLRKRRIRPWPWTFRPGRCASPGRRKRWQSGGTYARVSKSGRVMGGSWSTVGHCGKDCGRPATPRQPLCDDSRTLPSPALCSLN
jgi:hypothetical protein